LSTAYPQGCQRILWTGTDLFRGCPTVSAVNVRSLAWFPILDLPSSQGASDEYAEFRRDRAGVGRTLPRRAGQDHSITGGTGNGSAQTIELNRADNLTMLPLPLQNLLSLAKEVAVP